MRKLVYFWGPRLTSELRKRWVILKNPHADISFAGPCRLGPGFNLQMEDGGRFIVGKYVDFRRGFRAEIAGGGTVRIGDLCAFGYNSLIQCSTQIEIGERAIFGQAALVVDGNHRFRDISMPVAGQGYDYRPIRIGVDVLALAKVTVVNDVGTKSVVGANSVVAKPVPPYCLVAGAPARLLDYFGPPELAPPEWEQRAPAEGAGRAGRLEVSGNAVAFGGGVSAFEHRSTTRLAELLELEEVNRSVPGAVACRDESGEASGGYAAVLQRFGRPADLAAEPPDPSVAVVWYGMDELALLGPHGLGPFEQALRTIISRHRATAVFEEDDTSVTYAGSWRLRAAKGPDCSGTGVMEARSAGDALTISLPDAFGGGTVALGFVAAHGDRSRASVALDGEEVALLDSAGAAPPGAHRNGMVVRLTGVAPGGHAVTCTVERTDGPVAFDYWQLEPEPGTTVVVPLAFRPREPDARHAGLPHPPTDADVAGLNDAIRRVVAEFGGAAVAVETDPLLERREELFSWEGAFPNDEGHRRLAEALLHALRSAGRPLASA